MDTIMKYLNQHASYLLILFLATTFIAMACSTTGMQRSKEVQTSMQAVDNDIKNIIVQLDAIGSSLDELIKPGQADAKKAFNLYSENVSKIEKMEKDFSNHAEQMKSSGKTYFTQWDKNGEKYENPEIQKQSEERRNTLGNTYDKIEENSQGVKEAFRVYVSDVNEIQSYLSNDLTQQGIGSIESVSQKTVRNGDSLRGALKNLQAAIETARAEMAQSGIAMN